MNVLPWEAIVIVDGSCPNCHNSGGMVLLTQEEMSYLEVFGEVEQMFFCACGYVYTRKLLANGVALVGVTDQEIFKTGGSEVIHNERRN